MQGRNSAQILDDDARDDEGDERYLPPSGMGSRSAYMTNEVRMISIYYLCHCDG